ncbi:unnamed protein product, partial [Porites lobata]
MRGTDVYSEHYFVKTRICLKLARAEGRKKVRERFDVSKLQSEKIRRKHKNEARNTFEALGDIDDPEEEHDMILSTDDPTNPVEEHEILESEEIEE